MRQLLYKVIVFFAFQNGLSGVCPEKRVSGGSVEKKITAVKPVLKGAAVGVRGSLANDTLMGRCLCRRD